MKRFMIDLHADHFENHIDHFINEFHEWKGAYEQIDDVCVLGVRI